jgi:hypothetical protein
MSKFKVGDKIIAKENAPYMITTDGWTGVVTEVKNGLINAKGKGLFDKSNFLNLEEKYFDLVPESKIIITTDGVKTVTAKLYEGKKLIKTAEAKCSPEDKFDFGYGAAVTIERLLGNPKATIKEEKYFTGKARCVKCRNDFLTEGKIYEFVDGYSVNDVGDRLPSVTQVKSLTHLNKVICSDFEEVTDTDESLHEAVEALTTLRDTLKILKEIMQER